MKGNEPSIDLGGWAVRTHDLHCLEAFFWRVFLRPELSGTYPVHLNFNYYYYYYWFNIYRGTVYAVELTTQHKNKKLSERNQRRLTRSYVRL
jgi:hypothetical protein